VGTGRKKGKLAGTRERVRLRPPGGPLSRGDKALRKYGHAKGKSGERITPKTDVNLGPLLFCLSEGGGSSLKGGDRKQPRGVQGERGEEPQGRRGGKKGGVLRMMPRFKGLLLSPASTTSKEGKNGEGKLP